MTTTVQRSYKTRDVDMLIAASTIIQSAITNKTFLLSKRATWADPYFENLQADIDNAIQNYLGVDSAKELRLASQTVFSIQTKALQDLAEIKVQIVEDFKDNRNHQTEILTQLGFTSYHKEARTGDQEALINLLYQFKTNLTPILKTEIVTKGTPATILEAIVTYADTLKSADITQESNKATRKQITAEAIREFNSIYNRIISISKISNNLYKDNTALKEQFSFTKVSKTLNAYKKIQQK